MSDGIRQNVGHAKSVSMTEGETSGTAADIRALAEEAEAEAAEAEALAAAARARARAIQLRRQAELIEARRDEAANEAEKAHAAEEAATADIDTADTAVPDAAEVDSAEGRSDVEPESGESEEAPADTSEAEAAKLTRRWSRLGTRHRPTWSTIAACLAIVVCLAALAVSAYMIREHQDAVHRRQRVAEFAAAARQSVVTMTSLDFHDARQGVQRILENATGSFKDDFLKTSDDFIKVVEQSKVVSQGTVQLTAVDLGTVTKDSAVVLVASTQEVTNSAGAKQDPRNYRLIVTMARDGGQLKISKVEFVP